MGSCPEKSTHQHMKTTFKTQARVIVLLACILLTACKKDDNDTVVRVGYLPMVSSLTHFVALDQGFYADEGLEVDAKSTPTSNALAQGVVAGSIDAVIELAIVPLLHELESAAGKAMIFSTSMITAENGFDGILVKAESPANDLEGLAEKKVGVFPGTTARNTLLALFSEHYPGLTPPTCIELAPGVQLQSLASDEIDALFAYEPELTKGIVIHGLKQITTSLYAMQYSPSPIGVGAVNTEWAKANPGLAKRFYAAMDKAVLFTRQHPAEAREILASATSINPEVAAQVNIMPMSLSTEVDLANLDGYIEILFNMGEINSKPLAADLCIPQAK